MAFVIGAALSGLTAFVAATTHTKAIDSILGKYLRTLARGATSRAREDGTTQRNNLRQVFRYWRMERISASFMAQRLRRYQSWARCPKEHGAALAA
eukprot:8983969-Pyramimonas_sp.AAC.1